MEFCIKKRYGPGRIGELKIDSTKIITPNLLFVDTKRMSAPDFSEILISNEKKKTTKPILNFTDELLIKRIENNYDPLFIIENAQQLLNQPKKFIDFIINLREEIGYQKAIYMPSVGNPINLALLTYIGIDIFDSTSAIIAARKNKLLFEIGELNKNDLKENPCNCPVCFNKFNDTKEMKFQDILYHNYHSLFSELKHVRNAILNENLRNLVENRIKADPNLSAILRNLDRNHYNYLEKRTPLQSSGKIIATSSETLNRPEIKRFQDRVINRYKKPKSAKILLLLPCSAKKPYSFSKSHKLFREKLFETKNPHIVHEVIITSPIGIVPRELELVYPPSSYDIPVTGNWDEQEKKMITGLLSNYLKHNKYESIISHLPEDLNIFIAPILKNPIITCKNSTKSKNSLENLFETLNSEVNKFEKIKSQKRSIDDIRSLSEYQFGEKTADSLVRDAYIKGKYPYKKIFVDNVQLGMITKERGIVSLTLAGAEKLLDSKKYWVDIYDDFELIGSIFAPGIKNADDEIRIGDEVIVLKNEKLVAVGVAQMNGEEMINSNHGEAIKVRHKI
jgi:archaeosine synthase